MLILANAKEASLEFKVVPNKAGDIEVALDTPPIPSSTCRFEWDSSGATVEVRLQIVKLCGKIDRVLLSAML